MSRMVYEKIPFIDCIRKLLETFTKENDLVFKEINDVNVKVGETCGWTFRKPGILFEESEIYIAPYAFYKDYRDVDLVVLACDNRRPVIRNKNGFYNRFHRPVSTWERIRIFFDSTPGTFHVMVSREKFPEDKLREALDLSHKKLWAIY